MQGRCALVTGASSGLGVEFARACARRGANLVLAARRTEPMERLAAELENQHHVTVAVMPLDLSIPGCAAKLQTRLDELGIAPDILVNNAAFGMTGKFIEQKPERIREMLEVDILSLVELTHAFAQRMFQAGRGHILLVASLAAYQPDPLLAAYGAAKSFVLSFGEALHVELAPKVGVTVVSPGLVATEFFAVSGYRPKEFLKRGMLPAAEVAEAGVKAMLAGRSSVVVGRMNQASALASTLTPRRISAKIAYRLTKD